MSNIQKAPIVTMDAVVFFLLVLAAVIQVFLIGILVGQKAPITYWKTLSAVTAIIAVFVERAGGRWSLTALIMASCVLDAL